MFRIIDSKLEKEFQFKDFISALNFVNKVWELSERLNHHPDILIYSYRKVKINIFTHDENKVTEKDFFLWENIEKLI